MDSMGHFARSLMQKNICYFSASLSIELIACASYINPPDYKSGCSVIPRHGPMAVQNKIKVELIV